MHPVKAKGVNCIKKGSELHGFYPKQKSCSFAEQLFYGLSNYLLNLYPSSSPHLSRLLN